MSSSHHGATILSEQASVYVRIVLSEFVDAADYLIIWLGVIKLII